MRNRDASSIYILLSGALSLFYALFLPVELVYLIKGAGFNPLQLVLIGTLRQSMNFVFQMPTGILSDMYSRRVTVVLGILMIGAGYLLEGLLPVLAVIFAAQVFVGLGTTLMNGADTAWITDEVGADHVGPIYLRAARIGSLVSLPGIALSALLVNVRLNLPLVVSGALIIALGIVLAFVMPERHFTPVPRQERTTVQQARHTLLTGLRLLRLRPVLLTVLGVTVFAGVFSAGFNQLWNYYLIHSFTFPALGELTPVTWFSVIEVGIVLTNYCGLALVNRFLDTNSPRAVVIGLLIIDSFSVVTIVGFALAQQFALALLLFFLFTTATAPGLSLGQLWMNQHIDSGVRATLLSIREQVNALAQIGGGPLLGLIATQINTRAALVACGLILIPSLFLYLRTLRDDRPRPDPIPTDQSSLPLG
ncbi:tetracycline efflux MFS transporter TetA(P) [Dictyobacter sp. S3.2.2.5]|uniref:Tetracycline efflux MFS transporter TetA(P) n=2 Tax=Dictyobacter halimunensis TaxID=3026934 RepID=A0ABQ6G3X4_9CHLR|nr:tetracycline efflux MFS transporter TetA(P) [Dictyobacter sp. S3.2.2.5]